MGTKIVGIDGMTVGDLAAEIQLGGKFVVFQYCISVIIMTFKRSSNVYFIRSNESAAFKGLPFTLLSLVLGWWGIPWGPIYTMDSIITNSGGGKDVTGEMLSSIRAGVSGTADQ